jgi:hypothetical protein
MQIATEHANAVGQGAGIGMEKWFLLDGIALHPRRISPGNVELAAAIKTNLAHPGLSLRNGAAVTTGEAANAIMAELLVER